MEKKTHAEERSERAGEKKDVPEELFLRPSADDFARYDQVPGGTGEREGPYYRCLMVTTGQEEYVRLLLEAMHLGRGIIPKRVRVRKIRDEWKQDEVPLLPGYLFVHEEEEIPVWKYQQLVNVLRVLRYDREPYGYMRNRDMLFAQTLFRVEGRITPLEAVGEGNFVRITDGLLKDLNGTVLTVDRHKRQAKIRLDLMGMTKVVYMNYVLLEKISDPENGAGGDPEAGAADKAAEGPGPWEAGG